MEEDKKSFIEEEDTDSTGKREDQLNNSRSLSRNSHRSKNSSFYFLTVNSSDANLPIIENTRKQAYQFSRFNSHKVNDFDHFISPLSKKLSFGFISEEFTIKRKSDDQIVRKRTLDYKLLSSKFSMQTKHKKNKSIINVKSLLSQRDLCEIENSYEISITGYVIKNLIIQHVKYVININKFEKGEWKSMKVYRRYNEFLSLRELLKNKYIGVFIPSLPLKEVFGNKDTTLIEFRKKFLQIFMHELQICYFFKESEEIQAFMDSKIEKFPPDNIMILSNMTKESELILLEESYKNTQEKIKSNYYSHQRSFNADFFDLNCSLPQLNPVTQNYKNIPPEQILEFVKKNRKFVKMLFYKKGFLEKIKVVLNFLIKEEREISKSKINFLEELRNFQSNFIFAMNDSINIFNFKSSKSLHSTDANLKKMESILKEKQCFHKLLKNMNDWIYKEIINLESCIECIQSLNPYIEKLKIIHFEINKIYDKSNTSIYFDEREYEYINMEVKEALENKYENLKEIVAINSLFINQVEIRKYKACRFVYYYNSLKFTCNYHSTNYVDKTFYNDSLLNLISMMEVYLKRNTKYICI